jgi:glycosyltransferase involved in cell wall biosynthesis
MHVGVLVHSWLDDAEGGGNRVAHDLARFLHARGHRITVVVPALSSGSVGDEGADGFRVLRYRWAGRGASGLSRWQSHVREISRTLRAIHGSEPFDVLHVHGVLQGGGVLASRIPVPLVQTVHAPVMLEAPYRRAALDRLSVERWKLQAGDAMLHRLEGFVLRAASRITCLSSFMLNEVVRAHPWSKLAIRDKATVIRGGTNLSAFGKGIGRDEARADLGWGDEIVLLAVRRLEPRMGLELLLDVAGQSFSPAIRLILAGRGSLESALKARCAALGLDDRVTFAGFVPDEQLPLYYAAADVVVMPSVAAEGFGVSSVEALASGTPVVATPVGANTEITGSIDPRLVAADASVPALGRAILDTLDRSWDRDELARSTMRRFDVAAVGPEYERVLRGAAAAAEHMAAGA